MNDQNKEVADIVQERNDLINEGQSYLQYRREVALCINGMQTRAYNKLPSFPDYYHFPQHDAINQLNRALGKTAPVLKALDSIFRPPKSRNGIKNIKKYQQSRYEFENLYDNARDVKERIMCERSRAANLALDEFVQLNNVIRIFFDIRYEGNTNRTLASACGYLFGQSTFDVCFNQAPLRCEILWRQIVEDGYRFIRDEILAQMPERKFDYQ